MRILRHIFFRCGGATGTGADSLSDPKVIIETEILQMLLEDNFMHESWYQYATTEWNRFPGFYIVYKLNSRIDMPALDGRAGAPHPCIVDGERWALAWPSITAPNGGPWGYTQPRVILSDNFHQPYSCKPDQIKNSLSALRKPWFRVQVYLKAGIRLLRPENAERNSTYAPITTLIQQSGQVISYVRDVIPKSVLSSSGDVVVATAKRLLLQGKGPLPARSSVAHRLLPYSSIVVPDFHELLRAARNQDSISRGLLSPGIQSQDWDRRRLDVKVFTDKHCPVVFAARRNPYFLGAMADNSDQMTLGDPELEGIRNQAMAFERLFEMSAVFESYVDYVQSYPDRVKQYASGLLCS